jgi:hypothetical protein
MTPVLQRMNAASRKVAVRFVQPPEGTDARLVDIQGRLSVHYESYGQAEQQQRLQFNCIVIVPSPTG